VVATGGASSSNASHLSNSLPPQHHQYNNVADGSYRSPSNQPLQSVIPMDETTPYARGVDRTDLFAGRWTPLVASIVSNYCSVSV